MVIMMQQSKDTVNVTGMYFAWESNQQKGHNLEQNHDNHSIRNIILVNNQEGLFYLVHFIAMATLYKFIIIFFKFQSSQYIFFVK